MLNLISNLIGWIRIKEKLVQTQPNLNSVIYWVEWMDALSAPIINSFFYYLLNREKKKNTNKEREGKNLTPPIKIELVQLVHSKRP